MPSPYVLTEPRILAPTHALKRGALDTNVKPAVMQRKPRAFRECTNLNLEAPADPDMSSESYIPMAVLPIPFSPVILNTPILAPTVSDQKEQRRRERYSLAEEGLAATLQHCTTEPSPRELQIRALENATSTLSIFAQDARERAEKLRAFLADRQMEPEAFETMRRERWMEERRRLAVDEEAKAVLQHLEALTKSLQLNERPSRGSSSCPPTAEARRQANLIKFLERSRTRTPVYTHKHIPTYIERSPRRKTMDKVSPMRLRISSAVSVVSRSPGGRLRPVSMDGQKFNRQRAHSAVPSRDSATQTYGTRPRASLHAVAEDPFSNSHEMTLPASTTTTMSKPSKVSTPPITTRTDSACTPKVDSSLGHEDGTITIYYSIPHRPSSDELTSVHAPMPEYALDLLTQFGSTDPFQTAFPSQHADISSPPPPSSVALPRQPLSSSLQVPSQAPTTSSGSKHLPLGRPHSHRHLSSLFAIPEAVSSRLRVESREKLNQSNSGLFGKSRGLVETTVSASSTASLGSSGDARSSNEYVTKKAKKRFSALRRS